MTDNERLFGPLRRRLLAEATAWRYRIVWRKAHDELREEERQRPPPPGYEWAVFRSPPTLVRR